MRKAFFSLLFSLFLSFLSPKPSNSYDDNQEDQLGAVSFLTPLPMLSVAGPFWWGGGGERRGVVCSLPSDWSSTFPFVLEMIMELTFKCCRLLPTSPYMVLPASVVLTIHKTSFI